MITKHNCTIARSTKTKCVNNITLGNHNKINDELSE